MPRIGLLECDHVDPRYASIGGDYFDMFERLLPAVDLVRYDTIGGTLPARADECDGWVVTGSRHSVYEDLDWIHGLGRFIAQAHEARAPFVGICFGHQALAHFTGGRTDKAAGWGVGAHDITAGAPARLLYMHQDQVVDLPSDSVVLGSTAHCQHAVIQVGPSMLGIQAHPEFPGAYVEALPLARPERIGPDVGEQALPSPDAPRDEPTAVEWMLRFLR